MMFTTHPRFNHRCLHVLLAWGVACLAGCSSLNLSNPIGWKSRGDRNQMPTRVVAVWTDTIMNQPGQPGMRGVGGRLLFYAGQEEAPLQVSGKLTVYAYDDSEKIAADSVPARKFVFLPEQLVNHQSTSTMGCSYNVWLPWDEVGNRPSQLTLIARFEPAEGAVVMSDPARQMLPGVAAPIKAKHSAVQTAGHRDQPHQSELVLANYEPAAEAAAPGETAATPSDALETFTIDLPADVARRWHAQVADTLEQSPARSAANAMLTAPAQGTAGKLAPLAPPRRVESAVAQPSPSNRVSPREIPSRRSLRRARSRTASAAPSEQQQTEAAAGASQGLSAAQRR